jgi:predicted esterase
MKQVAMLVLVSSCVLAAQSPSSPPAGPGGDTRAAFLKLIDRPRVPLAPVVRTMTPGGPGLVQEHVLFGSDATERVPTIVVKSANSTGRRPVVIQLHGTGGNKEQLLPRLAAFAASGFVAVAIDGRYHGERSGTPPGAGLSSSYSGAILNAFKTGKEHPFFYDSVWDIMRLIDYLETRPDVDASRIGIGGFSKGGIETYLAAAVEPRIAVGVAGHGVQSFRFALDHGAWDSRAWTIRDAIDEAAGEARAGVSPQFLRQFYDRVAPGIYGQFDAPAMLPLAAPRPMLVINGDSDPRTPIGGVRESAAAAERAYRSAGAPEKFMLQILPDVGHEQTQAFEEGMAQWFARWLKP